ncbi:MAG: DUF4274 domain-containing protein [Mycobacterium sp.]|nr:DUF4274 domain-containing protein [Mycobacterium sp.]
MAIPVTPSDLHRRALEYNWDNGVAGARSIAEHPDCDRATALLLYWRLTPHYFRRYLSVDDVPVRLQEAANLVRGLETRLLTGNYRTNALPFDPADDGGVDRTRASDEEESLAVRRIPVELYEACGPVPERGASESPPDRLTRGCRSGDLGEVEAALSDGAWELMTLSDRRTLLGTAVEWNHTAVVERLLAAGVSPRFTRAHRTPLDDAPSVAMIDLLAEHGADPAKATLALAVAKDAAVIRRLVALGTPIDGLSRWGETALYRAAVDGHLEVLWALIELGADRGIVRQTDGRSALQAVDDRLGVLRAFLERDAPYDCPERTEYDVLTSVRIALTGDRSTEDARYW